MNYVLQHRLTRQYPRSDERFVHWTRIAAEHFAAFPKFGDSSVSDAAFYEFGTGWDLVIPLTYYGLGVDRQTVVDIDPHLRLELVNDAVRRFAALGDEIERSVGCGLRALSGGPISSREALRERFGITYLAPCDARDTGLPPEDFNFVSSTATLEHIPEADIPKILQECHRILKPGGLISCRVDMVDHFSYFDPAISEYNFLKFSEPLWGLINNRLNFTNRLRHSDYLRLIQAAGFEVVAEDSERPSASDLGVLRGLRMGGRFRNGYSLEDLGTKRMNAVLRKGEATRGRLSCP